MKNFEAVAEAMTWLGTPYHHQGRVKGVGVDCGTLICEVYEKIAPLKQQHRLLTH